MKRFCLLSISILLLLELPPGALGQSLAPLADNDRASRLSGVAETVDSASSFAPVAALLDSSVDRSVHADMLELSAGPPDVDLLPSASNRPPFPQSQSSSSSPSPAPAGPAPQICAVPESAASAGSAADEFAVSPPIELRSLLQDREGESNWSSRSPFVLGERKASRAHWRAREEINQRRTHELQADLRKQCREALSSYSDCKLAFKQRQSSRSSYSRRQLGDLQDQTPRH